MTTPEHTLVGIHLALACGLHQRFGWQTVALAGLASNVPDLDGVPMLFDMQRFEGGHRVWLHNVFSILLTSMALALSQYRWKWIDQIGIRMMRWLPSPTDKAPPTDPQASQFSTPAPVSCLLAVAIAVQLIHLPCDMIVSGGTGLTDWLVQPWWPLSSAGYVFPLIPWGDVGPTVLLMTGIIAVAKVPAQTSLLAGLTLLMLIGYLLVRGWSRGIIAF